MGDSFCWDSDFSEWRFSIVLDTGLQGTAINENSTNLHSFQTTAEKKLPLLEETNWVLFQKIMCLLVQRLSK